MKNNLRFWGLVGPGTCVSGDVIQCSRINEFKLLSHADGSQRGVCEVVILYSAMFNTEINGGMGEDLPVRHRLDPNTWHTLD